MMRIIALGQFKTLGSGIFDIPMLAKLVLTWMLMMKALDPVKTSESLIRLKLNRQK